MLKRKSRAAATHGAADGEKRRGPMVPAIGLAVTLIAAAFVLRPQPAAPAVAAVEEPPVEGAVIETDPLTLNLTDGGYLKVGVALQLKAPDEGDEATAEAETTDSAFPTARAQDLAVSTFGQYDRAALLSKRGREAAKKALVEGLYQAYDGDVIDVYLTTFVVQ